MEVPALQDVRQVQRQTAPVLLDNMGQYSCPCYKLTCRTAPNTHSYSGTQFPSHLYINWCNQQARKRKSRKKYNEQNYLEIKKKIKQHP